MVVRYARPAQPWISQADENHLRRWVRAKNDTNRPPPPNFARYNVKPEAPSYDDDTYERYLTHPEWSKEETDYLIDVFIECNGKWPVIIDHYAFSNSDGTSTQRSMEDLKSRFYTVSATLLQLNTPITSMTAPEYSLYETLNNFNPGQELSRKKLAEAHLQRRQVDVDEETVLLGELQRIMVNSANTEAERDELRRRLEYPHANTNGYQYTTSQALTGLWQQMLAADRMKKNQRIHVPNVAAQLPAAAPPPPPPPEQAQPAVNLSKSDQLRFGVEQHSDKGGVTFPTDRLSKMRAAKSTVQADKIAAVLQFAGVPDIMPLATAPVVGQFEAVMSKVHLLLDMRKVKDKEEQEIRVRQAEKGS